VLQLVIVLAVEQDSEDIWEYIVVLGKSISSFIRTPQSWLKCAKGAILPLVWLIKTCCQGVRRACIWVKSVWSPPENPLAEPRAMYEMPNPDESETSIIFPTMVAGISSIILLYLVLLQVIGTVAAGVNLMIQNGNLQEWWCSPAFQIGNVTSINCENITVNLNDQGTGCIKINGEQAG
jgi:hypothetical protein